MQILCIWHSIAKYEGSCLLREAIKEWFGPRARLVFLEADHEDDLDVVAGDLDGNRLLICLLDRASDCLFFSNGMDHRSRIRRVMNRFPTSPVVVAALCPSAREFADELRRSGREVVLIDDTAPCESMTAEDYVDPLFDALASLYPT